MEGIHSTSLSIKTLRPLFKNKPFLRLWGAQVFGQIGINILHFTLVVQVFQQTGNNFFVGLMLALLSLPSIFISPIAGALADSVNRRTVFVVSNTVRALLTVIVLLSLSNPSMLILLAFLVTVAATFFVPTEQASIPELVKKDHLVEANSLFTLSMYSMFLIGYTVAGPLLEYGGDFLAMTVSLGAFGIATAFHASLPQLNKHLKHAGEDIIKRVKVQYLWSQIKLGMKYIASQKLLLLIISQVSFIFAIERAVIALVPALAQDVFKLSIAEISFYMIVPLATGTVAGILAVSKLKHKYSLLSLIRAGLVIDAITLIGLPLYHNYVDQIALVIPWLKTPAVLKGYIMSIAFTSGLADVLIIVSAQTLIQRVVASEKRGRVFAGLNMIMNMVSVPLVLIITLMADTINISVVLVVFGITALFVVLGGFWYVKVKDLRIEA